MTDLNALAERVGALTGACRETDALVVCALFAPAGSTVKQSPINGAWCVYDAAGRLWDGAPRDVRSALLNGGLTASLDAVVALIERELPGACWRMMSWPSEPWEAWVQEPVESLWRWSSGRAATPALALLAAFLRARALKED